MGRFSTEAHRDEGIHHNMCHHCSEEDIYTLSTLRMQRLTLTHLHKLVFIAGIMMSRWCVDVTELLLLKDETWVNSNLINILNSILNTLYCLCPGNHWFIFIPLNQRCSRPEAECFLVVRQSRSCGRRILGGTLWLKLSCNKWADSVFDSQRPKVKVTVTSCLSTRSWTRNLRNTREGISSHMELSDHTLVVSYNLCLTAVHHKLYCFADIDLYLRQSIILV